MSIVGIPIYELIKDEYIVDSIGAFVGLFCGICMALSVAIEEAIRQIKRDNFFKNKERYYGDLGRIS